MRSEGANTPPTWGTLSVGGGGTGATTLTSGAYLIGAGTSAVTTKERYSAFLSSSASTSVSTAGVDAFTVTINTGKRYRVLVMGTYEVTSSSGNLVNARIGLRIATSARATVEGYWLNDESSNSLGTDNHETLRFTSIGTSRTYSSTTSGSYFATDSTSDTTTVKDRYFEGNFVVSCSTGTTLYVYITNSNSLTGTASQINTDTVFFMEEM